MANFTEHNNEENPDVFGVQEYIDEFNEESSEEEEFEDLGDMSEVEIRLEEANCLKALLHNSLFEEPLSPIAKRVERRVRNFIQQELKTLLGIGETPKKTPDLFQPEELAILKALAKRAISKLPPGTLEVPKAEVKEEVKYEPVVKKTVSPETRVKVRKARTPKVATTNNAAMAPTPTPSTAVASVTLPNGVKVDGLSTARQVKPVNVTGYPTLSPDQEAMYIEQQALTTRPNDGILGILAAAVDRHNARDNEE